MKPTEGSTVIGKSVVIRGELTGEGDLFLDGDLEGTITLQESRLTLGPNARVSAEVKVRDAVIFGRLVGNIQASGSVDLRNSADVRGDVSATRLSIEENAVIKGRVELTARTSTGAPAATGSQTATAKSPGGSFALQAQA